MILGISRNKIAGLLISLAALFFSSGIEGQERIISGLDSTFRFSWDADAQLWIVNQRTLYTYNSIGLTTSKVVISCESEDAGWVCKEKYEYFYNDNNQIVNELDYAWDEAKEEWIYTERRSVNFMSNGLKSDSTTYVWDAHPGIWTGRQHFVYGYDGVGRMTAESLSEWDTLNASWRELLVRKYDYDENGLLKAEVHLDLEDSEWEYGNSKVEHDYDSEGNIALVFLNSWDTEAGDWKLNYKIRKTYNGLGQNLTETVYELDYTQEGEPKEVKWLRNVRAYDAHGNMTLLTSYSWDGFSEKWTGTVRSGYLFDSKGQTIEIQALTWNFIEEKWTKYFRTSLSYDEQGFHVESLRQLRGSGTEEWKNWEKVANWYTHTDLTPVSQDVSSPILVYPNPASDHLLIDGYMGQEPISLKIIDLNGRLVKELKEQACGSLRICIEDLSEGYYLLHMDKSPKPAIPFVIDR